MPQSLPKPNGSFLICLLVAFLTAGLLGSCDTFRTASNEGTKENTKEETAPDFMVKADAYPYVIAMGKGRGVVFRVGVTQPHKLDTASLEFDTLYVAGKPLALSVSLLSDTLCAAEANYMKMLPEPEPGTIPVPTIEEPDPILYRADYYPAFLLFRYKGKRYQLPIAQFENHPL